MNKKELLKTVFEASTADTGRYLTDDFQATFADGSPALDKSNWLASGELMESAMPDMLWEFEYVGEDGEDLLINTTMSGTFRNDLDLSGIGLGVIPATGKRVEMEPIPNRVSFDNGKVSRIHDPRTGPDGGLAGILKALGVEAP